MNSRRESEPLFDIELDPEFWAEIRRAMAAAKNPAHAAAGVKALDAFRRAFNRPSPTQGQIDAVLKAVNTKSIVVARGAGAALGILARVHADVRSNIKVAWPTLGVKGRWAVLWGLDADTPETDELLRHVVARALEDPNVSIRLWAVRRAAGHGYRELLPKIVAMQLQLPNGWHSEAREYAAILEHGFAFRHDPMGEWAGSMLLARPDLETSYPIRQAAIDEVGLGTLGRLAAATFVDPRTWKKFDNLLCRRQYKKLGDWAKRL